MAPRSLVLLAVAAVCAAPAAASASTISSDGGLISFWSGSKASDLALTGSLSGEAYTFADAGDTLIAGPGCTQGPPVACSGFSFDLHMGGGADRAKIQAADEITESGGMGNDELYAWGNGATVTAGGGNDLAIVDTNGNGTATGNGGDDTLYGAGTATNLSGGDGNDFALGNAGMVNALAGGGGADALVARSATDAGGSLAGGAGADVLAPRFGSSGYGARWTLDGGLGDDVIAGSTGIDTVDAGGGRDTIDVSGDSEADTVTCGGGADEVWADDADAVAADCEVVHRAPAPELPAVTAALNAAATLAANVANIDPYTPGPMFGSAH